MYSKLFNLVLKLLSKGEPLESFCVVNNLFRMKVVVYELFLSRKISLSCILLLSRSVGKDLITLKLHRNIEVYSTFIGDLEKEN